MTDKEMEVLLALFQTNLAVVQVKDYLAQSVAGQVLVEKAIKNLDHILTKLEVK